MSGRERKKFLREMREKMAEMGLIAKKEKNPLHSLRLDDSEAREQMLYNLFVLAIVALMVMCCPFLI